MKCEMKHKHWWRTALVACCIGCGVLIALAQAACISGPSPDPTPPTGGRQYVLDYGTFATQIDSILTDHGCDNVACHGGGIRGTYELSPDTDKNVDFDFNQSSLQVNAGEPESSTLLTKPLAETSGGLAHAGGSAFASTTDPGYQAILNWILAGEYK
jgi:hypothetical protein